jgi:hypothetical protein
MWFVWIGGASSGLTHFLIFPSPLAVVDVLAKFCHGGFLLGRPIPAQSAARIQHRQSIPT